MQPGFDLDAIGRAPPCCPAYLQPLTFTPPASLRTLPVPLRSLPAEGSTLSVALTTHCIAYSFGAFARCYGQGGVGSSRDDQPTFSFLARLLRDATSEAEGGASLQALECALEAHPACVNARELHARRQSASPTRVAAL